VLLPSLQHGSTKAPHFYPKQLSFVWATRQFYIRTLSSFDQMAMGLPL